MTTPADKLGRLEKVDLREVWTSESSDFTPWLAQAENIALLGQTIELDLEVDSQEKGVGPFRADILCKDTTTGDWVLIENQLERTDHTHLGQLLTYAAGLKAVTIVWVAERFTDEHRAALDWLNEITDERFNFFGLEIELWKIGNSSTAPKFNIVCSPNDWSRTVGMGTSGAITETKRLQLEYWTAFHNLLKERKSRIRGNSPAPQACNGFPIGRSERFLETFCNTRENRIGVQLVLADKDAKGDFDYLQSQAAEIEGKFGEQLEWIASGEQKRCRIAIRRFDADPTDRTHWPEQHEWLLLRLEKFDEVFRPRVGKASVVDPTPQE